MKHSMLTRTLFLIASWAVFSYTYAAGEKPDAEAMGAETKAQMEYTLKAYVADLNRVEQVVYPLLSVGAPYCSDKRRWSLGASPRSALQLSDELQAHAGAVGLDSDLIYLTVLDGTPAAKAGIIAGDKLISINDEQPPKDKENTQWYLQAIQVLGSKNVPIRLKLLRGNELVSIGLRPHHVCNVGLRYLQQDIVNAYANRTDLMVTGGMLRFAPDDDELALVLGHELAHVILRHSEEKSNDARVKTGIGVLATILLGRRAYIPPPSRDPYNQEKELDSDYLGIYLAAAAGHNVSQVAEIWRRMAARSPGAIKDDQNSTHPSSPERYLRLQAAATEIADKQKNGQRLMPDMAKLKTMYDGDYVVYEGRKKITHRVMKASILDGKTLPDFTQVPFISDNSRVLYQKFLASKTRPRAFAISQLGNSSFKTGVNASADAIDSCNAVRKNANCFLYVMNDELVYDSTKVSINLVSAPLKSEPKPLNVKVRAENPSTQFAELIDLDALPIKTATARAGYQKFLEQSNPRAFAISSRGRWYSIWGMNPADKTLPSDPVDRVKHWCDKDGDTCKFYAIDNDVVWKP